jgi:hypothetical protein
LGDTYIGENQTYKQVAKFLLLFEWRQPDFDNLLEGHNTLGTYQEQRDIDGGLSNSRSPKDYDNH